MLQKSLGTLAAQYMSSLDNAAGRIPGTLRSPPVYLCRWQNALTGLAYIWSSPPALGSQLHLDDTLDASKISAGLARWGASSLLLPATITGWTLEPSASALRIVLPPSAIGSWLRMYIQLPLPSQAAFSLQKDVSWPLAEVLGLSPVAFIQYSCSRSQQLADRANLAPYLAASFLLWTLVALQDGLADSTCSPEQRLRLGCQYSTALYHCQQGNCLPPIELIQAGSHALRGLCLSLGFPLPQPW